MRVEQNSAKPWTLTNNLPQVAIVKHSIFFFLMNVAFLSIASILSADSWRHSSYQRSAGASVAQAANTVVLLLGPRGSRAEQRRGSSRGQRAHRGSRAPMASHRTAGQPGPTLGVRTERRIKATQASVAPVRTRRGPTNYAPCMCVGILGQCTCQHQ